MQHVELQVQHRGPDPHGRKYLDEGEPPVGQKQPQAMEEHGQAPTASASGARMRRRRLSWTTAASTMASLPSRIVRMSSPACLQKPVAADCAGGPVAGALTAATSWPASLDAAAAPFTCSFRHGSLARPFSLPESSRRQLPCDPTPGRRHERCLRRRRACWLLLADEPGHEAAWSKQSARPGEPATPKPGMTQR